MVPAAANEAGLVHAANTRCIVTIADKTNEIRRRTNGQPQARPER